MPDPSPSPIVSFTQLLSLKAQQKNISHRQVSLKADLSSSYFTKVLKGMVPSLPAFARIVRVLDCSDVEVMTLLRLMQDIDIARKGKE